MSDPEIIGRCLCNRVAYAIKGHLGIFQYCHCSRCRKFTGSAFAANLLVAPADFRWIGGEESRTTIHKRAGCAIGGRHANAPSQIESSLNARERVKQR